MAQPDVSIIIVTFNTLAFLQKCLAALPLAAKGLIIEFIVVDNGSTDGTSAWLHSRIPKIQCLFNTHNLGFARATNQGLKLAQGRHLLLLNPDTEPYPCSITTLTLFSDEHPDAGIVGPKILKPNGEIDYLGGRRLPSFRSIMLDWSGLSRRFPRHPWFAWHHLPRWDHHSTRPVPMVSGACLMSPHVVWERLGPLDERFFLYTEDADWCLRVAKAGLRIYYVAEAVVLHHGGISSRQVPAGASLTALQSNQCFFRKQVGIGPALAHRLGIASIASAKGILFLLAALLDRNRIRRGRWWREVYLHVAFVRWAFGLLSAEEGKGIHESEE